MCLKVEVNSALSALCNVYGFIIFEITSDLNLAYDLKISFLRIRLICYMLLLVSSILFI